MALYKLFSCNVEVQYKSYFLSRAMLFTIFTTILNLVLPFIIAYRARGFWLKSESFFEQPEVRFNYDYLMLFETDDASRPIVCSNTAVLEQDNSGEEFCSDFQVHEETCHDQTRNCKLHFKLGITLPPDRQITSGFIVLGLDFLLKTVCPLQMQSLAIVNKDFSHPSSGLKIYGDLQFYQVTHLPCSKNTINAKFNTSLLSYISETNGNVIDFIIENDFRREAITQVKILHSRTLSGHTGKMHVDIHIRIPEMKVYYIPSLMQELKWAWPQYLSLAVVFYWLFNRIKRFVFNKRLLMAWEVIPWKK